MIRRGLLLVPLAVVWGHGPLVAQVFRPDGMVEPGLPSGPTVEEIAAWAETPGEEVQARDGILGRIAARPAGPDATLWVELLGVLDKMEPSTAGAAIRSVGFGEVGRARDGADLLMDQVPGATAETAPALLAIAAHLAERVDPRRAAEIRERLLDAYPEAPEAPEATMLRARWLLQSGDLKAEGLRLLEQFIVDRPEHPLAPEARRLYQANGGRS